MSVSSVSFNLESAASNVLNGIPKDGSLYEVGVRDGDMVTNINGDLISNYDDILTSLALVKEGSNIDITIKSSSGELCKFQAPMVTDEEINEVVKANK